MMPIFTPGLERRIAAVIIGAVCLLVWAGYLLGHFL